MKRLINNWWWYVVLIAAVVLVLLLVEKPSAAELISVGKDSCVVVTWDTVIASYDNSGDLIFPQNVVLDYFDTTTYYRREECNRIFHLWDDDVREWYRQYLVKQCKHEPDTFTIARPRAVDSGDIITPIMLDWSEQGGLKPTHYWLDTVITYTDTTCIHWDNPPCDTTIDTNWVYEVEE